MMSKMEKLRQTGRTTRMIDHAKILDAQRRAVYIVAANEMERNRIRDLVGKGTGIKVDTPWHLGNLDWETMALRGAHDNCVVIVDHYTIESKFAKIIEMLHRYDEEEK